jgi:cytidine deaminase
MGRGAAVSLSDEQKGPLVAAARAAACNAYAPYSRYAVGAALLFEDGEIVTGCNVENASYGLALCAETVAVARAFAEGRRGGLVALAVVGPEEAGEGEPITPCGRCRQVIHELAQRGGTDPLVLCVGRDRSDSVLLSALLPRAFGPVNLA